MKRSLARCLTKTIYLYLPFGLCITGTLVRWNGGFRMMPDKLPMGSCSVVFAARDVVAVNVSTGDAFWLKGASVPSLPNIKSVDTPSSK